MDWDIIRIVEDLGSPDAERWMIVYQVPTDISDDGILSVSIPKTLFNSYAAAYEYDIDDPAQLDELFDLVMTTPMLSHVKAADAGRSAALAGDIAATEDTLTRCRSAMHGGMWQRSPEELRADVKAGIGMLKSGVARLKPAARVELQGRGLPEVAPAEENPKYIVMRDMVAHIDPDLVAKRRAAYRDVRAKAMAKEKENRS